MTKFGSFIMRVALATALPLSAPLYAQDQAATPAPVAPPVTAPGTAPGTAPVAEAAIIIDGREATLDAYLWVNRPLVVFADSPADPAFSRQIEMLRTDLPGLAERDVIVLTDTDPAGRSDLRQTLRPRGFTLVLVGKDGGVKLRKPTPWSVREISRAIDKVPMRQQELREQHPVFGN